MKRIFLTVFIWFYFVTCAFGFEQDEFVMRTLKDKYTKPVANMSFVSDELLINLPPKNVVKPEINAAYDYSSIKFAIVPVRAINHITSKRAKLNQEIFFITTEPVKLKNGKVIPVDTEIIAKIAFLESNRMRGYPAMMIVENFRFKKFPDIKLDGQIVKQGFNHSIWAYPASRVLMSFGGLGFALHPIKGGHAKISPKDRFELYIWKE